MNGAVASVLNRVLGDWIENLNSDNLNLSIFSGQILLQDLRLKTSAFHNLGLPFHLEYGHVGKIYANIPWTALSTSPLRVLIEDIHIFLNPLPTEHWKPDLEIERRINQKLTTLKQLEALKNSEVESKTPGFVEKLVGKIVYNLQIEVKNVYFRYTDSVSSSQKFSFGAVLGSLKAVTCNSLWNEEFMQESSLLFKLVQVSGLRIFLDYEDLPEMKNEQIAKIELESGLGHNYLLPGLDLRLEAVVNKDKDDLSLPQLRVDFKVPNLSAGIDTIQLKHALKTINYINLFSTFQKGVFQSNPEVDFTPEVAEKYRILFMQTKTITKNKQKTEVLVKEMEEIERNIKYESILQQRAVATKELELAKLEAATKEEIESASAAPSTLSKLSGFFSRKPATNDDEKKEKIAKLREKLNNINESKERLRKEVESFISTDDKITIFPDDYIKNVFKFSIEHVELKMVRGKEKLLEVFIENPNIDVDLANSAFFVNGGIQGFRLVDLNDNSKYSDIVTAGCYSISLNNKSGLAISMKSGDLRIYTKIRPILNTVEAFKDPFVNEFNYSHYTENAAEKTKQYIAAGEKYLAEVMKTGLNVTLHINIDLKAPKIFIPINPDNPEQGLLVIDFGKVLISNSPRKVCNKLYDMFSFKLLDFVIWVDDSYPETRNSEYLLEPVSIELALLKSLEMTDTLNFDEYEIQFMNLENVPNLLINLNLNQIKLNVKDSDLIFLNTLKKVLIKEVEHISKPPPINKDLIKLNEPIEVSIVFQFNFRLRSIILNLITNQKSFASAEVTDLVVNTLIVDSKNVRCDFYLAYIELRDNREGVKLSKVICNPALLVSEDDEFTDALEELNQFSGQFVYDGSTSIKLVMNDLRVVASPDMVSELIYFSRGFQDDNLSEIESESEKVSKSSEISNLNLNLKVELSNITLLLPLDINNLNRRVGLFNVSVLFDYSILKKAEGLAFAEYEETAVLNVKRIMSIIGMYSSNNVKNTHQKAGSLLEPTQLFLRYSKKASEHLVPSVKFSLDQTFIDFGFRDADFFNKLISNWQSLKTLNTQKPQKLVSTVQSKPSQDLPHLSFEVCLSDFVIQLNDDTLAKPIRLAQLSVSQSTLRGKTDKVLQNLEFRSKLSSICYNEQDTEDIIEPWEFSVVSNTNIENNSLETVLTSETPLNINISERMIKTLNCLKKKFKEQPQLWEEERKDERNLNLVKISNMLGEDIIVSICDCSPKLIGKGGQFDFIINEQNNHFILEVDNSDKVFVEVDLRSKEFNIKRDGTYVGCMLKLKENTEENEMILQTETCYYNLSDKALEFSWDNQKIQVSPNVKTFLPLNFCGKNVKVLTDSGPSVLETSFAFGSSYISVEKISLKDTENFIYLYYIFLPTFYVQNLLPCPIQLLNNPLTNIRAYLLPGETKSFPINPKSLGKLQITFYLSEISASSWFEPNSAQTKVKIPSNNQRIMVESTDFDIFSMFTSFVPVNRNINCKLFHIYSRYIIVNKTLSSLEIKRDLQIDKSSVGFLRCKKEKLKFRALLNGKYTGFSRDVNAKTVGLTGCVSLDNPHTKNLEIQFGVQIVSAPLPMVKSKVIIITPRYVIHNTLGRPIFIRQIFEKGTGTAIQLPSEKVHFQLENSFDSKNIQLSSNGKHWSKTFSVEDLDDFQISLETLVSERDQSGPWYLPGASNDNRFFVQVSIFTNDQACIMIHFKFPKEPEFLVKNNIETPIVVSRGTYSYVLHPSTQIPWADSDHVNIKVGKNEVSYNLLKVEKKVKQINNIKAEVRILGVTRILEFGEFKLEGNEKTNQDVKKFEMNLSLGISLFSEASCEMFNLTVSKIYFSALIKTKKDKQVIKIDFRVHNLQLDNMQKEEGQYPVIISGLNDPETPFFQAKVELQSTSTYTRLPWIEVIFQETCIQLNLEVLYKVIDILGKYKELVIEEVVFVPKETENIYINFPDLNPIILDIEDQSSRTEKIYVNILRLYAIKLLISFKVPSKKLDLKLNPLQGFGIGSSAKTLLSSFANITDSSISFTEIIVTDSFQYPQKYIETISHNYVYQGIRQVYRLLGSSDMLGNPIRLMGKLGTGVFEFISEPMKGLLQGPKSLPGGVKKGVKSLVGNIVGGGMHTVSTITGNLYNVVNKVKGEQHQDISSEKIKGSIVGGLKDIGKGVTGIFSKPWQGLKKDGGSGLVKGIGSGLFGAVSAPISAGLRVASGISSEVTGAVSVKRPDLVRIREPKVIKKGR